MKVVYNTKYSVCCVHTVYAESIYVYNVNVYAVYTMFTTQELSLIGMANYNAQI